MLQGINDGCIDLIYLDPPFNKKKQFTAPVGSSAEGASFSDIFREEDIKDDWVKSIEYENPELHAYLGGVKTFSNQYNYCYLVYMAIRLLECQRILKPTGSIYLHCDPTMSHHLKVVMDCIFGEDNFRNEIIWRIGWVSGYKTKKRGWVRNHDSILYYTASPDAAQLFNKEYIPYPPGYVRRDGKPPTGKGIPIEDTWNCSGADVLDSIMIKSFSKEKTGYPTQKPLALLERIIKASSNEGDVVLDPFCGCATTCVAAEKLKRQWIGIDVSIEAYDLVKKRLKREVQGELPSGQTDLLNYDKAVTFQTKLPKRDCYARKEGYVYIISNPASLSEYKYKVGISKDPKARLSQLQTGDSERGLKLEFQHPTPHPLDTERSVHKAFERKHEWVKGELEELKEAIVVHDRQVRYAKGGRLV